MLRPGGGPTTAGGLLEAIAVAIHGQDTDVVGQAIEVLCQQFDIVSITEQPITSFAAALIMDPNKASGSILIAQGTSAKRRRFSIGHELGHFLIPSHLPRPGRSFSCSHTDFLSSDPSDRDSHRRVEAQANRFAAHLLMPPARIRAGRHYRQPDLADVVRLADEFRVSKEAMARSYAEAHRENLAVVILCNGRVQRIYRSEYFPFIEPGTGQGVTAGSIAWGHRLQPGEISEMEECDPETWLSEYYAARVEVLSEQVLGQSNGYATVLLHAEMAD